MKGEFEAEQTPESTEEDGFNSSALDVLDQLYREPMCSFGESCGFDK
jgi:hypothetical protein